MIDSMGIYKKAQEVVKAAETRDALRIASDLGILVQYVDEFEDLLGMYTCRWKHRIILLNSRLDPYMTQMVTAHEIGHDMLHRHLAKEEALREFVLFNIRDNTEYEANAFAAHLLLDNDTVYEMAREGYDIVQISKAMDTNINLMLIKMQEMNKLGYSFNLPISADSKFFKKMRG